MELLLLVPGLPDRRMDSPVLQCVDWSCLPSNYLPGCSMSYQASHQNHSQAVSRCEIFGTQQQLRCIFKYSVWQLSRKRRKEERIGYRQQTSFQQMFLPYNLSAPFKERIGGDKLHQTWAVMLPSNQESGCKLDMPTSGGPKQGGKERVPRSITCSRNRSI